MLEHKIVEKEALKLVGLGRKFDLETAYIEIPKYWDEFFGRGFGEHIEPWFALSYDFEETRINYMIADYYSEEKANIEGFEVKELPAGTWAVFPCRGPMPTALQEVNTKVWNEWFPSQDEYEMAADYSIEFYSKMSENPEENYTEIWVPVKKVK